MPETIQHKHPEALTSGDVDAALQDATTRIREFNSEPDFLQLLADSGIAIDTDNPDEYWGAVASYADQLLTQEELSPLERDSLAVTAYLPLALTHGYYLANHQQELDYSQKRAAKETASNYNSLLKHFVATYPQTEESLRANMLATTLETIGGDQDSFTRFAEQNIAARLRGIKHEIGFGELLDTMGVTHRDASLEEDLKGKDVIISYRGKDIGVDVKASLDQVDAKNRGSNGTPIAHKPGGDIVMFSMLLDSDFDGGFHPRPDRLAEIAPVAGALLQRALNQSIAKS